jgi:very-short-patch-repair endonuclease
VSTSPDPAAVIAAVLQRQSGVISVACAVNCLGRAHVRWKLARGYWQRPCRGVVVTFSGPVTREHEEWVAVVAGGQGAVLAGLAAARLDGLTGFTDRKIHLLVPGSRRVVRDMPADVVVHRSGVLGPSQVHPLRLPPRTRPARSLVDAAAWMGTENGARAVLAAGVQQRLVRVEDLRQVLERRPGLRRRALIASTLRDIAGGAEALSELDFCRLTRRFGLPEPDRQTIRRDERGHRRWLDAYWKHARLVVEVDGRWHMEAYAWWADMRRDNDLTVSGLRVLRFPAFAVRDHPEVVAAQIRAALDR